MNIAGAPRYYEPGDVLRVYVERAGQVARAAEERRALGDVPPAKGDRVKIAAFGIDAQIGFASPGGSLFVPGATEDTQRTLHWLYRNLGSISRLFFSLDTHAAFQIFHPAWWMTADGKNPAPFTVIRKEDVVAGRFRATRHPDESLEYVTKLEAQGRYALTIWPYHTLLGAPSHALVPAVAEAALYHALVRDAEARFLTKGAHPLTESYSVLSPEVTELGGRSIGRFEEAWVKELLAYDRVYVFGQASSHCVLSTLRDLATAIETTDRSLMERIYVLTDAMSPVPPPPIAPLPPSLDFPALAAAGLQELERRGMRLARTTDPVA